MWRETGEEETILIVGRVDVAEEVEESGVGFGVDEAEEEEEDGVTVVEVVVADLEASL